MIIGLLFIGSFLVTFSPVLSLSCIPCSWVRCSTPVNCKGGLVKSICGCCSVCAKVEGEQCGGWWQTLGRCDSGLQCVVRDERLRAGAGTCEPAVCKGKKCGFREVCTLGNDGFPFCTCSQACNGYKHKPVCGYSNGKQYNNQCERHKEECQSAKIIGVTEGPCKIHGGWSSWSVSTPCSVTCGMGVEILSRTCTNPTPKHGGRTCSGAGRKQQACTKRPCPIDGGWSKWSGWTSCTKTCESGSQQRSRSCTQPPPRYGGKSCPGPETERQTCNTKPCPIDGRWSGWSGWSSCSKSCGTGFRKRSRSCTRPVPSYGGKTCKGAARERQDCNTHPCPVHGGWSSWTVSKLCSVTCGSGVEFLARTCTNPAPKHGGKSCPGAAQKQQACTKNPCPIHGGWSKWSNWTECNVTCGAGVMLRQRHCDNPVPAHGGRPCEGNHKDRKSCVTGEVCIAGMGCYEHFPSVLLGSFTKEIDWFAHFSSQMQAMVKKCAHLAVKKRQRYFGLEGFGNCYGAQSSPSGAKVTQCNFGVGLDNYYYVYEVSL